MPAYIVILVDVEDAEKCQEYGEAFNLQSFMQDYGGEFIMMSNEPDVVEGKWNDRLVVMKFPDAEKARAWYDSPKYHDVRKLRWASSTTTMILVPGFDPAAFAASD